MNAIQTQPQGFKPFPRFDLFVYMEKQQEETIKMEICMEKGEGGIELYIEFIEFKE